MTKPHIQLARSTGMPFGIPVDFFNHILVIYLADEEG